jgi:hypothetical protein
MIDQTIRRGDTELRISGSTDVFLIVGDPVEQVKAPESFNRIFARFGIDAVLVPAQVPAGDLLDFVRAVFKAPNIRGLWVTIPHKTPITALLAECDDLGRVAGAVNAVRRNADGSLSGALFDGEGFVRSLDHFGVGWREQRLHVVRRHPTLWPSTIPSQANRKRLPRAWQRIPAGGSRPWTAMIPLATISSSMHLPWALSRVTPCPATWTAWLPMRPWSTSS